ncbi:VOC family protein [Geomonas sp.]|uniref:VOC family protein n=1 Tax=Geomonas sp. TaxID=2651584 RepID=UPI002B462FC8|nr:VOC family protein [Geomonas sp.]HJV35663.1 VOC family protein [Geomonas sp.]
MAKAIPEGYGTVTPALTFKDARKALNFYKEAFGAKERYAMEGPDGKGIMHAEMMVGNSIIMLGEEHPEQQCKSAESAGGSPVGFYLYVEDVDAAFQRAVACGAQAQMPVQEMFWGDRMGSVRDPFGYNWMLATHTRDLSIEEIREGAQAVFTEMSHS